jgi:hypothetical protein
MMEDLSAEPVTRWRRYILGNAALEETGAALRFVTNDTTPQQYSDAQLDDYGVRPGQRLIRRPPLRLTVRAHFSLPAEELRGTAGFGFWNYPFIISERRLPRLPRAIWFFYASPPANMRLDLHTPGYGWKAATIDTQCPAALALLPIAPLAVLLMQAVPLYRGFWPLIQHTVGIRETIVPATMTEWHTYEIEWGEQQSSFRVDGRAVLEHAPSPGGPLSFVMWLDNQYLIVTPQGRLGWGLLAAPGRQWMEVERCTIEPLI